MGGEKSLPPAPPRGTKALKLTAFQYQGSWQLCIQPQKWPINLGNSCHLWRDLDPHEPLFWNWKSVSPLDSELIKARFSLSSLSPSPPVASPSSLPSSSSSPSSSSLPFSSSTSSLLFLPLPHPIFLSLSTVPYTTHNPRKFDTCINEYYSLASEEIFSPQSGTFGTRLSCSPFCLFHYSLKAQTQFRL